MPIATVADFRNDRDDDDGHGQGGYDFSDTGRADGEKLPPWGPGNIYHEKQIGNLCAVHCLNNLLQGRVFDEVKLAQIANDLDAQEQQLLGGRSFGGHMDTGNVRMDGFFNIEVIRAGLMKEGFQMDLIRSQAALPEPSKQEGFICNKKEHWFALRRIGEEWFDLNSCLRVPKHFTSQQLVSHINEALKEGYSVFAVKGKYPICELARDCAKLKEAAEGCGRAKAGHCLFAGQGNVLSSSGNVPDQTVDPELLAMAESDPELAAAIAASLQESKPAAPAAESMDEIRRKRLARFG